MVISLMPETFAAAAHLRKCPLSMKSMRGASGRERYRRWGDDPTMDVKVAAERPVERAFGRNGVQPCALLGRKIADKGDLGMNCFDPRLALRAMIAIGRVIA